MDWKQIGRKVADFAPMLGAALGGPAGASVGSLIASKLGTEDKPEAVMAALGNPDIALRLREIESAERTRLQELLGDEAKAELQAESANTAAVNATMQVEARAEHFMTYSWRPAIGWSVAIAVVMTVLTVFLAYGFAIFMGDSKALEHLPGILMAVTGIIGVVSPILGIASWYRGRMQAGRT